MTTEAQDKAAEAGPEPMQFRERADAGDPEAQYRMGLAYVARDNVGRARRWLQRAADSGHGAAAFELGVMHLEGGGIPASPRDAVPWFRRGAEAGSTAAMCRLAEMLFSGYGTSRDEDAARDWLLEAARAGERRALRQLGMIYARLEPSSAWEPRAFACLHRAATLGDPVAAHAVGVRLTEGRGVATDPDAGKSWLAFAASKSVYLCRDYADDGVSGPPEDDWPEPEIVTFEWPAPRDCELERLAEDPPVHRIRGMVDPEMCDYLINRAFPCLEPAHTVDPETGRPVRNRIRTNKHAGIHGSLLDIPTHMVEKDMTHAARADVRCAERLAMLRYGVGEEYKPHYDYLNPQAGSAHHDYRESGQRVKTVFAFLNDVPAGGETEFPRLGIKVKPERGGGVLFRNVRPEGTPDDATLHAGCPVIEGEKWLATLWVRERPLSFR